MLKAILLLIFASASCYPVFAEKSDIKSEPQVAKPSIPQHLFKFWNFDQQPAGESPVGFSTHTVGAAQAGSWKVESAQEAPSSPNRLSQSTTCPTEACFHLLLAEGLTYEYFDVVVRLRPAEGSQGGGGMVFAVMDRQNFYAAVADFEANTVEVIRMLDGKATVLGRSPMQPWKSPWHLLRVRRNTILSKEFIEVIFDNKQVLSLEDRTLSYGQIGLATTGKNTMTFDNLNAVPLYSQKPLSPPAAY